MKGFTAAARFLWVHGKQTKQTPQSSLTLKQFNKASFVLRLPEFKEAVNALPKSDDAKHALQLLRGLQNEVQSLTGDARKTWVFHPSGSFALHSTIQEG